MDGLNSVKCRKSKLGDIDGIIEFVLNDNNAKNSEQCHLLQIENERKHERKGGSYSRLLEFIFRERRTSFSLDSRAIGLSDSFGQSDCQIPSGQEGKLFYTKRATRGLRF